MKAVSDKKTPFPFEDDRTSKKFRWDDVKGTIYISFFI